MKQRMREISYITYSENIFKLSICNSNEVEQKYSKKETNYRDSSLFIYL